MITISKVRVLEWITRLFTITSPFIHKKTGSNLCLPLLNDMTFENITILIPHPDDEIVGCFHFIEHIGAITPVDLIYVTEERAARIANLRYKESAEATKALVIHERFKWGFPDGDLIKHRSDLRQRLFNIQNKYGLILCPAPNDKTPDHTVLAEEACNAIPLEKLLWYRSTWWTFPLRDANFIVEGKATKKRTALRSFKTQDKLALQNAVTLSKLEARYCDLDADSIEGFRFASSGLINVEPLNVLSLKSLCRLKEWL